MRRRGAHLYQGNLYASREFYQRAAGLAGIREKISMHLNAHAAYSALKQAQQEDPGFGDFLKANFLS